MSVYIVLYFIALVGSSYCFVELDPSAKKDRNSFGPYTVDYKNLVFCKGPKIANSTISTITLSHENNSYIFRQNLTLPKPALLDEIKIILYRVKEERNVTLWSYKISDPCQHFFIASILSTYSNINSNCVMKKGKFTMVINFTQIESQFFGPQFFYGEFLVRIFSTSKKSNIICIRMNISVKKKTKGQ